MNNLHGWAMSGYLPYGRFQCSKNVDNADVNSISEKSPIGYILEADLEYPDELHVLQNDYLLTPEKRAISSDILRDYCKKIAEEYEIKVGDVEKLIAPLGNKTSYVLHYRNCQLYLSLGMKLVNKETDFSKYISRPTHITHKIFGKNYPAIHEIKRVLTLNKPIYV